MPDIIVYATKTDGETIRQWINSEDRIAWIVKDNQIEHEYHWRAIHQLDSLEEQAYSLWHIDSGSLNVPSGSIDIADTIVKDPFVGWVQTLDNSRATQPWFGANLPGPFNFVFKVTGTESIGSLGRSEFSWFGNRYKVVDKPASELSKKWWSRLVRFIKKNTTPIPYPYPNGIGNSKAYAFPGAYDFIMKGGSLDINP